MKTLQILLSTALPDEATLASLANLGDGAEEAAQHTLAGFYSNGEIGPMSYTTDCKLHNQTMTVTYLGEQ